MTDKLLPCPFCGGNDIQIDEMESFWDKNETSWRVLCIDCIAETAGDTKEQAIAAWNRRAQPENKPPTNADRIRAMPEEELAVWLIKLTEGDVSIKYCGELKECNDDLDEDREIPQERCEGCMLGWLGQPYKEG